MLIAVEISTVLSRASISFIAMINMPSMPSVPLISARPSLATNSTGVIPAPFNACAASTTVPSSRRTSPSPITASAHVESGARSPEQPRDPYSRTSGVMWAFKRAAYASAVVARIPVRPVHIVESRRAIMARTTSLSTGSPEPAACERMRERCNWARISGSMCLVASAPKPVEIP